MSRLPHLPVLRAGRPYESVDRLELPHVKTGEPVAEVSRANAGLIARDLRHQRENREALEAVPTGELLEICARAAVLFTTAELPLDPDQGTTQSFDDYVEQLASTTGMPHALGRANAEKIRFVLAEMPRVLGGLTRGLDLAVLDRGYGLDGSSDRDGERRPVSFRRRADALGVVLPSNSPGVHSLWLPAIPLKTPLVLRPGTREPWTPLRIAQALLAAGCPPEAISYYPGDHAGATEILLATGRSMLFGDEKTVGPWAHHPKVELHGPGWSKVVLGPDTVEAYESLLPLVADSVAANGGRSCINASGLWLAREDGAPSRGRQVAEDLAHELAKVEALPLDHPQARLAAWSDPEMAARVSEYVDGQLEVPGAHDLSRDVRGDRLVEVDGLTYLLPTVVWCEDPEHPLASAELLFPFVSVVERPAGEIVPRLGPSLVVSAVTEDPALTAELLACPTIERLNLGPISTCKVSWDQPHEGNLFEHLFQRRAFQHAGLGLPEAAE